LKCTSKLQSAYTLAGPTVHHSHQQYALEPAKAMLLCHFLSSVSHLD
jgi:hypothetical protein